MLTILVPAIEYWDEVNEIFVSGEKTELHLEHSLVSVQKWESKWGKAFLSKAAKTAEETIDYIKCMLLEDVEMSVIHRLTKENIDAINDYIAAPMTATTFPDKGSKGNKTGELVTAEIIYYWMVSLNIPLECENWHLNRLITLIRVCDVKSQPAKKMKGAELAKSNAAINRARRKKYNTNG